MKRHRQAFIFSLIAMAFGFPDGRAWAQIGPAPFSNYCEWSIGTCKPPDSVTSSKRDGATPPEQRIENIQAELRNKEITESFATLRQGVQAADHCGNSAAFDVACPDLLARIKKAINIICREAYECKSIKKDKKKQ